MSGRPFELVIDGETRFCAAFETEVERRAALSGDLTPPLHVMPPVQSLKESASRARGRPSFDVMLTEVVETLQLDRSLPLADRARAVLRHLVATSPASEIPSRRTVENFLAVTPARRNSRNKSRKKIRRCEANSKWRMRCSRRFCES